MVFGFLKKAQKAKIGLDITPEGITGVMLKYENNKTGLKKIAFKPFNEEVFQNGIIVKSDAFVHTLKEFVEENNFETEMVNIAVQSNVAFLKTISMPDIPPEELKVIIPQEIPKHINFPINEINFDYEVIKHVLRNDVKKEVEVLLVALSKHVAKNLVDLIYEAGLSVSAIDLTSFAVIRTLANEGVINNNDALYISVCIGYENTDINIINKGLPLFFNNVQLGKKDILKALIENLEIDKQQAEDLLSQIALIIPGMEINPDPSLAKAAAVVRSIYKEISDEIHKTIEFYQSHNQDQAEVKKIILSGTGLCIQNVEKYISARMKIETVISNALTNIEHSPEHVTQLNGNTIATSIGLALKG